MNAVRCILTAMLLVLAAPPIGLWPLALVALVPLVQLIRESSALKAFGWAWLTGSLALLGSTYWWVPLLKQFASLSFLASLAAAIAFALYQGLSYALWGWLCHMLTKRCRISWLLAAPLALAFLESVIPFSFKHYLAITVWQAWPLTQIAEIGGPPAVSAVVVLINVLFAELLIAKRTAQPLPRAFRPAILVLVVVLALGTVRALHVARASESSPSMSIGIVQPNFGITPSAYRERYGMDMVRALRKSTDELAEQGAELIIWPESSWPYVVDRLMKREYPDGHPWEFRDGKKTKLLIGTLTHEFGGSDVLNSALLVDEDGRIAGLYDKKQLTPFGEFIPFAERYPDWAKKCRERLPDWPEIVPGDRVNVMRDGDLRIGMMICSEDLAPSAAASMKTRNPNLLVSIASDAWFGASGGPAQHLALASFRAIEMRRDLVRATNTGVSGIVDARGRVRIKGPLVDVPYGEPQKPDLLTGDARIMEIASLGPLAIPFFPYFCGLALILAIGCRTREKPA